MKTREEAENARAAMRSPDLWRTSNLMYPAYSIVFQNKIHVFSTLGGYSATMFTSLEDGTCEMTHPENTPQEAADGLCIEELKRLKEHEKRVKTCRSQLADDNACYIICSSWMRRRR